MRSGAQSNLGKVTEALADAEVAISQVTMKETTFIVVQRFTLARVSWRKVSPTTDEP